MQQPKDRVDVDALGGVEGIHRWVARFYDKVAGEPVLAPMFTDLERAKDKQQAYFVEFFGGPKLYSAQYGKPFLRYKHRQFKIGVPERDAWMKLVIEALRDQTDDERLIAEVQRRLGDMADKMINHHSEKRDAYYFNA